MDETGIKWNDRFKHKLQMRKEQSIVTNVENKKIQNFIVAESNVVMMDCRNRELKERAKCKH